MLSEMEMIGIYRTGCTMFPFKNALRMTMLARGPGSEDDSKGAEKESMWLAGAEVPLEVPRKASSKSFSPSLDRVAPVCLDRG
jgi:hypothetical protein